MLRPNALPIWQQISLDVFAPPILTLIAYLLSRGNARVLSTDDDPAVQGWMSDGWKYLLGTLYVLCFATTIYGYFF